MRRGSLDSLRSLGMTLTLTPTRGVEPRVSARRADEGVRPSSAVSNTHVPLLPAERGEGARRADEGRVIPSERSESRDPLRVKRTSTAHAQGIPRLASLARDDTNSYAPIRAASSRAFRAAGGRGRPPLLGGVQR